MSRVEESKRDATQARQTYKTRDDFLRWLRKKDAGQKELAQDGTTQPDRATSRALMVWADDGGATA